jgi:hypothetical protein
MRRALAFLALLAASSGCGVVSFRKPPTDEELRLTGEVRSYYAEVQRAFAAGNPQALSSLFDASITRPMSKAEIDAWAEKFFAEHGRARFRILSFEIDDLGHEQALVTLKYAVEPADGTGGFGATEQDSLVKRNGRWYTRSWERAR